MVMEEERETTAQLNRYAGPVLPQGEFKSVAPYPKYHETETHDVSNFHIRGDTHKPEPMDEDTTGGTLILQGIHGSAAVDSTLSIGTLSSPDSSTHSSMALSHGCGSEMTDCSHEQHVLHADDDSIL
jgi:hypothetical protein